ncbi:hypothetical protein [Microbacterium sp. NPDC089695]|uniref:hypothetical protein n=1 Tax=Microbacterium sp. NPDC089695 TaxID=3364198 RepID=UPI0037F5B7B1
MAATAVVAGLGASMLATPAIASDRMAPTYTSQLISCSSGNFRGEAVVKFYSHELVQVSDYRIIKLNGQSGGSKANVNTTIWGESLSGYYSSFSKDSPDAMKQDGVWRPLGHSAFRKLNSWLDVEVQFIFDKSGSDPRCTASTGY